jgi:ribonuclease HI
MSACGVYFGPVEDYDTYQQNWCWRVRNKPGYAHTSQRAELHAALGALYAAKKYATEGGQWPCDTIGCPSPCRVRHVVIKSDSAYLVNSLTSSIKKWQLNGWQTANKTPVKNRDLWEVMIQRILELEDLDTAVDFWLVPRQKNKAADAFANAGLDSGKWFSEHGLLYIEQESDFIAEGSKRVILFPSTIA